MVHKILLSTIACMCLLWTGTFLHDIDQLQLDNLFGTVVSTNHHGHSHGHSHFGHHHGHGSRPNGIAALSEIELHGHSPILVSNSFQNDSPLEHLAPLPISHNPAYTICLKQQGILSQACAQRPPPDVGRLPIYIINRAFLI